MNCNLPKFKVHLVILAHALKLTSRFYPGDRFRCFKPLCEPGLKSSCKRGLCCDPTYRYCYYSMAACMMSWKLVLVAFATALIASSSCDSDCEGIYALTDNRCSYYSDLLENALLNDSDNVYLLQLVFFPSSGNTPREVGISVTITVGEIVSNGSCYMYDNCWPSTSSFSETGHYNIHLRWKKPHDSEDVPVKLFSNIAALGTFESVFCMIAPIVYYDYIYGHGGYSTYVSLELQLDQLPCNPCRDITYDTVAHIFTWVRNQLGLI